MFGIINNSTVQRTATGIVLTETEVNEETPLSSSLLYWSRVSGVYGLYGIVFDCYVYCQQTIRCLFDIEMARGLLIATLCPVIGRAVGSPSSVAPSSARWSRIITPAGPPQSQVSD